MNANYGNRNESQPGSDVVLTIINECLERGGTVVPPDMERLESALRSPGKPQPLGKNRELFLKDLATGRLSSKRKLVIGFFWDPALCIWNDGLRTAIAKTFERIRLAVEERGVGSATGSVSDGHGSLRIQSTDWKLVASHLRTGLEEINNAEHFTLICIGVKVLE